MEENDISFKIRGAIYKVFNSFGPGLLESVYVAALAAELKRGGLTVKKRSAGTGYFLRKKNLRWDLELIYLFRKRF